MSVFSKASAGKPLPLKQRTSSLDTRRDYSYNTWWSVLQLLKIREYLVTVDNFSIWRRHLAWAMEDGKDLRAYMTQRYGSSMVFMSLLLSTELSVLFNSAQVTTNVRVQLRQGNHESLSFWAGFMIIISALLTILSLISLFTAWGMVNSISESNAHCIFRSSIGQYAAELPGRLIVGSIYSFLSSFMIFFFLLLPLGPWSIVLLSITIYMFIHVVSTFSAFGRVIMHTGAMGNSRIFTPEYEEFLVPHTLHSNLLTKAQANLANNASIIRQYRRKQQPIDRHLNQDEMFDHLSGRNEQLSNYSDMPYRPRADSTVRFADVEENRKASSNNHHSRTLTPLSDYSSSRLSMSSAISEMETPRGTTVTSSLRKSSYGGPSRRPTPPPGMFPSLPEPELLVSTTSSGRNVSNASLEQWLQASPSVSQDESKKHSNSSSLGNSNRGAGGSTTKMMLESDLTSSPGAMKKPRPLTPTNRPHKNSTGTFTSENSELSSDDHRELSEDERFALEYGDDFDDDGRALPSYASEYKLYDTSPDTPSTLGMGNESMDFRGSERMSLLDRSSPSQFYSTSSSSDRRVSQETKNSTDKLPLETISAPKPRSLKR